MALISPQFISGMRLLSRNTVNRAWLTTPASKSLTGLRRVDADVVIHMDGHLAPQRHVVGHAVVRLQLRPLFVLEHDSRQAASGATPAQDPRSWLPPSAGPTASRSCSGGRPTPPVAPRRPGACQ